MKPTLYLPMMLLLAATAARGEDKPTAPAKQQSQKSEKPQPVLDRAALEKEFTEKLTGAALVGTYTIDGQNSDKPPQPERYELERVSKVRGDYWLFLARIKYGEKDVKLPITLKIVWAEDTPMISMTDFNIPVLGTFTCRIMFYGDRYAGTWQHGEVGGHMWGKIEPAKNGRPADAKNGGEANGTPKPGAEKKN
jgi:hypothetical protein